MAELAIDTLQYADRLEEAGVGREQADAMARALEEQLGERMPTKTDINARFDSVDARFDSMDARFDSMDARFDFVDARFERVDARFERMDARLDAMDAKFEAKFDGVDHRFRAIDSRLDALEDKLRLIVGVMIFGFTLLTALGLFQSFRSAWPGTVGVAEYQRPPAAASSSWPTPAATQTTVPMR